MPLGWVKRVGPVQCWRDTFAGQFHLDAVRSSKSLAENLHRSAGGAFAHLTLFIRAFALGEEAAAAVGFSGGSGASYFVWPTAQGVPPQHYTLSVIFSH